MFEVGGWIADIASAEAGTATAQTMTFRNALQEESLKGFGVP
jgi:hypothetical protein